MRSATAVPSVALRKLRDGRLRLNQGRNVWIFNQWEESRLNMIECNVVLIWCMESILDTVLDCYSFQSFSDKIADKTYRLLRKLHSDDNSCPWINDFHCLEETHDMRCKEHTGHWIFSLWISWESWFGCRLRFRFFQKHVTLCRTTVQSVPHQKDCWRGDGVRVQPFFDPFLDDISISFLYISYRMG